MKFSIMDHSGHSEVCFGEAEVAQAMEKFQALLRSGHTAAVRAGNGELQQVRSFDPAAPETLFVPQLKGG